MPGLGSMPIDDTKHTRWVRDTPRAVRKRQQQGYRLAKEEEVREDHDGYRQPDGSLRNGDTVLMIVERESVERRKEERDRYTESLDKKMQETMDHEGGLTTEAGHGQRSGTKFYSLP